MIRVLLSAPLCLHIRLSSRFTCWPDIWIVPVYIETKVFLSFSVEHFTYLLLFTQPPNLTMSH
jgi:hypothetical protein